MSAGVEFLASHIKQTYNDKILYLYRMHMQSHAKYSADMVQFVIRSTLTLTILGSGRGGGGDPQTRDDTLASMLVCRNRIAEIYACATANTKILHVYTHA